MKGGDNRLLVLERVTKAYGKTPRQCLALSGVGLEVRDGEFVCLLGPSGCGKSTLLRIITGLIQPSSGNVLYRSQQFSGVNPYTTIVFQTFALYPWLTVEQNVELALKARGIQASARRRRALELIDMVGLDGFESAFPRELSGGMRQKVGFARAMAVEPELLCLDEPFSALDVLSAEALRGELMELWTSKSIPTRAILMVTHNIEEAALMADRIVVMGKNPGHVVAEIPITLRHPRHRKDTAFQALTDKVYAAVTGKRDVAEPSGRRQALPRARLNAVAGLLEKVAAEGGRADLYRLSQELAADLGDILPVVEAAEKLGFLTVEEGDLLITRLGEAYAEAKILARKELLAGRALRLPLIAWVYETLQQDDDGRVAKEYFVDGLQCDFGERSEEQVNTAIQWGRAAELFDYDMDRDELFIED